MKGVMFGLMILSILLTGIISVSALNVIVPDPKCETSIAGNCVDSTPIAKENSVQNDQTPVNHNSEDIAIFKNNLGDTWKKFITGLSNGLKKIREMMQKRMNPSHDYVPGGLPPRA